MHGGKGQQICNKDNFYYCKNNYYGKACGKIRRARKDNRACGKDGGGFSQNGGSRQINGGETDRFCCKDSCSRGKRKEGRARKDSCSYGKTRSCQKGRTRTCGKTCSGQQDRTRSCGKDGYKTLRARKERGYRRNACGKAQDLCGKSRYDEKADGSGRQDHARRTRKAEKG